MSVTDITYSPTSPAVGNSVSFTATILNGGSADLSAGSGFGVDFYLDGTKLNISGSSTAAISAGGYITVTSNGTWTATSGNHNLYAIVDPSNVVAESNEGNNQSSNYGITVSGGTGYPVPGKVEAENYSDMYGVATETCSEGTLDVGWIDAGDYMDYSINVASAGIYEIDLRLACNGPTGTIQLQENGNVLETVTPSDTGGWQNWATQSAIVTLPAGVQTLRVYSTGNGWNLNYLNIYQANLAWNDEFDGSTLNTSNWTYDTGAGGWGNNELEYYTNRTQNVNVQNGNLIITAQQESYGGANYTSGRIKTQGLKQFTYGKIEARIKLPAGQGLWPAFWMLGSNITSVGWPQCGELDIMEHINNLLNISGSTHWYSNGQADFTNVSGNLDFSKFHTYDVTWDANYIRWYVDGVQFNEFYIGNGTGNTQAFQNPFFIILNLAVGGNWPGSPDGTTVFPAQMLVDYVRVYNLS